MAEEISQIADLMLTGAEVITMEEPICSVRSDIAVADGRILAVGKPEKVAAYKGTHTHVVESGGKTIMPGLIDSHAHMVSYGAALEAVDLTPESVKGRMDQLFSRIRKAAAAAIPGEWIHAWGFDDSRMDEKRYPTIDELDAASPDHPLKIKRTCGHIYMVNRQALEQAEIRYDTPDPEGGKIGRNPAGIPDGLLFELGAINLVNRSIPRADALECARLLAAASKAYVSEGVTLVTEAGAAWSGNPYEAAGFQRARDSEILLHRVSMGVMEDTYRLLPEQNALGLVSGFGDDHLWIGPAKFVVDGSIGAGTAAMYEPYGRENSCGVMCEEEEDLRKRMEACHRAGFQLSVHAIGDKTIDMVLRNFESILSRFPRSHRHRIEHAAVCRPDFLPRIASLGLTAVVQPAFIHFLGESFINNLDDKRLAYTIALKSLTEAGVVLAGSSDRPVTDGNPWKGIWAAVARITTEGRRISPEQALTPAQALRMYTYGGAFANGVENRLGTLSPGKFADLIILKENPLSIEPDRLKEMVVEKTLVGGRQVYESV